MCVDYQKLNRYTIENSYPLPLIEEIFGQLCKVNFFSKIDLRQGYIQFRLDEDSIPLISFRTGYGHFEFLIIFVWTHKGPCNIHFNNEWHLRDYLDMFAFAYLEDILIYSRTYDAHQYHFRNVLSTLRREKFYSKLSKWCQTFDWSPQSCTFPMEL